MASEPKEIKPTHACIHLESVDRFTKLPLVEGSYQTGKNIYDKVKDLNSITNWTMSTAENTIYKAVEIGRPYAAPVVQSLETPIKKVDGFLCTGLDYVESKVEGVKLPPGEIYNSTKDYIKSYTTVQKTCELGQSTYQGVKNIVEPAMETAKNTMQSAKNKMEPAFETAKHMVEPAVQGAKNIVEPYVQSSLETANAIKDYGTQKIEEYLQTETPEKSADATFIRSIPEDEENEDSDKDNKA